MLNGETVPNQSILVSILIPVRNEEKFIERCLLSCFNQTYPLKKMEIIVIDGMSEDRTREIVLNYMNRFSNIKLVDNPKKIAPSAMNIGIRESKGDIIIRVDGHAELYPDYVEKVVEKLKKHSEVWAVGGPIETIGETKIAKAIAIAMSSQFGVGNSAFRTIKDKEMYVDTVPFPGSPRWIYDLVGLYDEELVRNQDDEHNLRILEKGGKILLTPEIKSRYYSRNNFKSLFKQYFQYGYYKVVVIKKHPKILRIRHFVPFFFVLSLIFSLFFLLIPFGFIMPLSVYGSYIIFNLLFSIILSFKNKFIYFYLISISFLCLHLGYGLGFLSNLRYFLKNE